MANLTDYFIPSDFAEDDIERRQSEIAVRTVFVIVPIGLILSVFVYWLFGSIGMSLAIAFAISLIGTAPFVLRSTGNMDLASLFIVIPLFITLCVWSWSTGGVLAPGASYLVFLPLLGLIFRGLKTALVWLVLIVVTWAALYIAGEMGAIATAEAMGDRIAARRMSELLVLALTVFGFFYLKNGLQEWLIDVVRKREAETRAAVEEARDRALEASHAKSTFLATMSHELRTPLNAVIGYSEMISEELEEMRESEKAGAELADQFVPDLGHIQSAGRHLLSIINDILNLSKIEAGKMTVEAADFQIDELVGDLADTLGPVARDNENTLEVDIDAAVGVMHSDSTKVRQILFNLMSNSCKFTSQGSVHLQVSLDDAGEQVVFVVEDTGIGMTEEQLIRVFDAFSQADSSTTREFGGTGLGLTITSHLCDLLGGEIDVDSTAEEGTTFTVRLPKRLPGSEQRSAGDAAPVRVAADESV